MAVNQQNASFIHDLRETSYYEGAPGDMPGGNVFTACALFRINYESNGFGFQQAVICNGLSTNRGWGIYYEQPFGTPTGQTRIIGRIGDGATVLDVKSGVVDSAPMSKLVLVHLVVNPPNGPTQALLYVNGSRVATLPFVGPAVPSAAAPRVGRGDGVADDAAFADILGVAYLAGEGFTQRQVSSHFQSCHRAMAMGRLNADDPAGDFFTNRFDVREGAVVPGDVNVPPAAASVWQPSAGTAVLTRVGVPRTGVTTNPVWATLGNPEVPVP